MRTLFTVAHYRHIPRVMLLAQSIQKYHPQDRLQIWLTDVQQSLDLPDWEGVSWHYLNELSDTSWEQMAKKYGWEVFRENMKVYIGADLLQRFERILFVDPRSIFFQPCEDLWAAADSAQMVLIPELLQADGHPKQEVILNQGIYQNHVWVARQTEDSFDFFSWWKSQVKEKGYVDVCRGLNADRYFLEIAPSIFPNFTIYRHPGIGVSHRNLPERKVNWFQRTSNDFPLVLHEFQEETEYPASVQPLMSRRERKLWEAVRPQLGMPELSNTQQKIRASLLKWEARIHRFFDQF